MSSSYAGDRRTPRSRYQQTTDDRRKSWLKPSRMLRSRQPARPYCSHDVSAGSGLSQHHRTQSRNRSCTVTSAARQNEVGLAARAAPSCRAPAPAPPSCIDSQARFIRMKSTSKKRTPSIVNLTVKRRYLTEREVERLNGLRAQVWPIRASRRDHDPGRLSPRSAGLGGLRLAMAADRAIRGPPTRSPGEEWDSQRAPDPR